MPTFRTLTLVSVTGSMGATSTTRPVGSTVKTHDNMVKAVEDVQIDDIVCVNEVLGFQRVTGNDEVVI